VGYGSVERGPLAAAGRAVARLVRCGNTLTVRSAGPPTGGSPRGPFPANRVDGVLFLGTTVDVRFRDGIARAGHYKGAFRPERTVLVLGPGNIALFSPGTLHRDAQRGGR
jgi:hypothetical protein